MNRFVNNSEIRKRQALEKIEEKRLVIEIQPDLHNDIKKRALFRNITIRKWVLIAILEQIKKEKSTE